MRAIVESPVSNPCAQHQIYAKNGRQDKPFVMNPIAHKDTQAGMHRAPPRTLHSVGPTTNVGTVEVDIGMYTNESADNAAEFSL